MLWPSLQRRNNVEKLNLFWKENNSFGNVDFSYNHFDAWLFFFHLRRHTFSLLFSPSSTICIQRKKERKTIFISWPTSWWHYLECSLNIFSFSIIGLEKHITIYVIILIPTKSLIPDNWWRYVLYKYFAIVYYNAINECKKNELLNSKYENRSLL